MIVFHTLRWWKEVGRKEEVMMVWVSLAGNILFSVFLSLSSLFHHHQDFQWKVKPHLLSFLWTLSFDRYIFSGFGSYSNIKRNKKSVFFFFSSNWFALPLLLFLKDKMCCVSRDHQIDTVFVCLRPLLSLAFLWFLVWRLFWETSFSWFAIELMSSLLCFFLRLLISRKILFRLCHHIKLLADGVFSEKFSFVIQAFFEMCVRWESKGM